MPRRLTEIEPGWRYIEHLGDLFLGPARGLPKAVWSFRDRCWLEYGGGPKGIEWGSIIDEDEAQALMNWKA